MTDALGYTAFSHLAVMRWSMTHIKTVMDIAKDAATIFAPIGGGAWTIYTFSALGTRARAQAEQFKQAVLDVVVDAKVEARATSTDSGYVISAIASVINKGTRNTFLDFRSRDAFTISRIAFNESGVGEPVKLMTIGCRSSYMTLRVGATGRFPVYFRVAEPALYQINFAVDLSDEELHIHRITAQDELKRIVWSGSTHLVVE